MLTIERVDLDRHQQVERFINLPYRLYARHPYWTPPLRRDIRRFLDTKRFHYYKHSSAGFFLAVRNGQDVGRIVALEHRPFNEYHDVKQAQFYWFDCTNDPEAATALLAAACDWARQRGLHKMVGPKGFTALDGYGVLIEGFAQRQTMSLTNYNHSYYSTLVEAAGFRKAVDFVSCSLDFATFQLAPPLRTRAEQLRQEAGLTLHRFRTIAELRAAAPQMLELYNAAFIRNWEYYPLPPGEMAFIVGELQTIAVPDLFQVVKHGSEFVGLLFALPDLSGALQRTAGRLTPWGIVDLLWERRRLEAVVLVLIGMLEPYQHRGGGALLLAEMEQTCRKLGVQRAELINMAESADQVQRIRQAAALKPHKIHRVYEKSL